MMEIKLLEERENPFLRRKEVRVEVDHKASPTPKKEEIVAELAKMYSVDQAQVAIDYIFTRKGTTSSLVKAKILERPKEILEKKEVEGERVETQASESK